MAYLGNTPTTQGFIPAIDFFSGNGSTVAFTLSRPVASVAQVQATIENVPQNPGTAFTVSGNTITFDGAPPSGTNNIYVYYTSPITQVIQPGQGTVGLSQLTASGSPSSSTFLRGDNSWQVVSVTPTAVSDQLNTSTGYFDLPTGTAAQRPGSPVAGMLRFNTSISKPEVFNGSGWASIDSYVPVAATGGTITQSGGYTYHTFTTSGTFQVTGGSGGIVEYLVVAGGGGGGWDWAGGGGAGGYISGSATVSITSYSIVVGGGGAAPANGGVRGGSGGNSSAFSFTSIGGGGGGSDQGNDAGINGGSGGGGAIDGGGGSGTAGQGNTGASGNRGNSLAGGGGGGASAAGLAAPDAGGAGTTWLNGTTYAGGGGGGRNGTPGAGGAGGGGNGGNGSNAGVTAGTANTGGGGGGGGAGPGAAGGSGIVVIRYLA